MSTNLNHQLTMLCDIIHESSHFMQRDFGEITQLQNSKKGTKDFTLKCYDRIKSKLIRSLEEKRPQYGVILPEEGFTGKNFNCVIEPISGIRNFSRAIPFCAIAAALFENKEPIAVAIHNPILRETFYAAKGLGAWLENYNQTSLPKSRIRVSSQLSIVDSLIANDNINLGCDLLELAYLAAARIDLVPSEISNHMVQASLLLVREAGGMLIVKDQKFIAGNEALCKQAQERYL